MTNNDSPVVEDDLQAYVDGRLEPGRRAEVEAYLARTPEARERVALDQRLRAALRGQLEGKLNEPIPPRLWTANILAARRQRLIRRGGAIAAGLLLFSAGLGLGWVAGYRESGEPRVASAVPATTGVADNAATAYRTFVVEVAHPVEVAADHQAHLLTWLSKRLGKPIEAPDLAPFGYRLMGGRLLPADQGSAAQLMYDDASGRRLTVYVRAADGAETAFRFSREGEASTFAWIDRGFGFAVTGQLQREQLLPIAEAVYHRLSDDPSMEKTRRN